MENQTVAPEFIGYLAAASVLTAAGVERIDWIRYASFLSNVLFISYALLEGLLPVLLLHAALLPINAGKSFFHMRRMLSERASRDAETGDPGERC